MTSINKYNIHQLLMFLLIGALSVCSLAAQTEADSVRTSRPNGLIEAFDGIAFDDALPQYEISDSVATFNEDSIAAIYAREMLEASQQFERVDTYFARFNPEPQKAVWMSALFPGAGQIYNRKYWKLPIIYGGFLGLIYGYNWNQRYYKTYQNAYRDLVNDSPNASYLQLIRGRDEEAKRKYIEENKNNLATRFKSKKNTYRNWRDYCVVGMLGVYLVSIVDAYVDASLYHFDVSPDLDAYNNPSVVVSYTIDF